MSSSRTAFLLGGLHALSFDNSVIAEHEFQDVGSLGATNGRAGLLNFGLEKSTLANRGRESKNGLRSGRRK
jgi:hypothetical protein